MRSKRGMELPMNAIIIIVILLVALMAIIFLFQGRLEALGGTLDTVSGAAESGVTGAESTGTFDPTDPSWGLT